jgi:hypothetical protein
MGNEDQRNLSSRPPAAPPQTTPPSGEPKRLSQ